MIKIPISQAKTLGYSIKKYEIEPNTKKLIPTLTKSKKRKVRKTYKKRNNNLIDCGIIQRIDLSKLQ